MTDRVEVRTVSRADLVDARLAQLEAAMRKVKAEVAARAGRAEVPGHPEDAFPDPIPVIARLAYREVTRLQELEDDLDSEDVKEAAACVRAFAKLVAAVREFNRGVTGSGVGVRQVGGEGAGG